MDYDAQSQIREVMGDYCIFSVISKHLEIPFFKSHDD